MKESVYNVTKYIDEIMTPGNGPTLKDCAKFLRDGYPEEKSIGKGPLIEPGSEVHIQRTDTNWVKYPENVSAIPEDVEFVAIVEEEGEGWDPENVFCSLEDLKAGAHLSDGEWLAYGYCFDEVYIWDGDLALTKKEEPSLANDAFEATEQVREKFIKAFNSAVEEIFAEISQIEKQSERAVVSGFLTAHILNTGGYIYAKYSYNDDPVSAVSDMVKVVTQGYQNGMNDSSCLFEAKH